MPHPLVSMPRYLTAAMAAVAATLSLATPAGSRAMPWAHRGPSALPAATGTLPRTNIAPNTPHMDANPPLCRVSYAPQHSYTPLDLSVERIATHDAWYMNGDGGNSSSTLAAFFAQNSSTTRGILERYVASGAGKDIVGGQNTTNLIVLDIEAAAPLKRLGLWLADERANSTATFENVVAAYTQRVAIARSVFPRAQIALYGSPAQ